MPRLRLRQQLTDRSLRQTEHRLSEELLSEVMELQNLLHLRRDLKRVQVLRRHRTNLEPRPGSGRRRQFRCRLALELMLETKQHPWMQVRWREGERRRQNHGHGRLDSQRGVVADAVVDRGLTAGDAPPP